MPFFGIFDQECLIGVFLGKNFENSIVMFEITTLKFVYLQNFTEKQKCLNLEPKMPDFGSFGLEFENQHPRICLLAKFCGKTKMPKFGTKNAIFRYF